LSKGDDPLSAVVPPNGLVPPLPIDELPENPVLPDELVVPAAGSTLPAVPKVPAVPVVPPLLLSGSLGSKIPAPGGGVLELPANVQVLPQGGSHSSSSSDDEHAATNPANANTKVRCASLRDRLRVAMPNPRARRMPARAPCNARGGCGVRCTGEPGRDASHIAGTPRVSHARALSAAMRQIRSKPILSVSVGT
jgi:hypothetical protein